MQNRTKIIIASVISLIFIFTICFFSIPRITYTYDKDIEGYVVEKVYGNSESYTIKAMYNDKPVKKIGKRAFEGLDVKNIYFEKDSNLEVIASAAFRNCTKLKSIYIPSSVKTIYDNVFNGCSSLESVKFSEYSKLEAINSFLFMDCVSLSDIYIPKSVKSVGSYAFFNCKSLREITFYENVEEFYGNVFELCSNITITYYDNAKVSNDFLIGCTNLDVIIKDAQTK